MNNNWIIYTVLTVAYIIILVIYFLRRSRAHEKELVNFLQSARQQLEEHKEEATKEAQARVSKAVTVVRKVQEVAQSFEEQAQKEYQDIIDDAKAERRDIIASAKAEIEELFKQADRELEEYKLQRQREIEKNLVKLVISVTERVVEVGLTEKDHKAIIEKCLNEVKQNKARVQ